MAGAGPGPIIRLALAAFAYVAQREEYGDERRWREWQRRLREREREGERVGHERMAEGGGGSGDGNVRAGQEG